MPAAPARIPSVLAALAIPASPTDPTDELLQPPTTYATSLPPAEPPPTTPNPPSTDLSHHPDPRGCLIDHIYINPPNHLLTTTTSYHTDRHPWPDQASHKEFQPAMQVPSLSDSVVHVKCRPRVFGLRNDHRPTVRIKNPLSLIDGGANICLTNNLNLLVDAINIQLLPITVALDTKVTLDDCCTK
jgi:hypothetical protein